MTGIPTGDELATLVADSQAQCAAGPPPAISHPVIVDEDGYAWGLCPDDARLGTYVHAGVRLGWLPMHQQGGLLLALWGGPSAAPEFQEEGVTAFLTLDGARRLAADLAAIADSAERGCRS